LSADICWWFILAKIKALLNDETEIMPDWYKFLADVIMILGLLMQEISLISLLIC
jgi:hypothetical protein